MQRSSPGINWRPFIVLALVLASIIILFVVVGNWFCDTMIGTLICGVIDAMKKVISTIL
jgi:hypothetical protein